MESPLFTTHFVKSQGTKMNKAWSLNLKCFHSKASWKSGWNKAPSKKIIIKIIILCDIFHLRKESFIQGWSEGGLNRILKRK